MSEKKSGKQLVDEVIAFLEREREIFGDFDVDGKPVPSVTAPKEEISTEEEAPEQPKKQSTAEKQDDTHQEVTAESASRSQSGSEADSDSDPEPEPSVDMESQEKLFGNSDKREIYYKIKDCNTLEELHELCRQADVLRTDLEGTNLVFGTGSPNADLVLVGEAPGAEEDKQGEPFVGKAGQLLNKILAAIDFDRDDVYIANILKHRPPNNRNPKQEERERSLPFLLRQIDLIEPKLILCLGKVAAQTLLDNDNSLSSMRETFHSFRGKYELMATYHPAALLRHSNWKRPTWEDVQLLRKRYDELGCKP